MPVLEVAHGFRTFLRARTTGKENIRMVSKGTPPAPRPQQRAERRGSRRCKITQVLRARPSNPAVTHFEDVRGTLSVSRHGIYFHTDLPNYELGMRLFVTLPYSEDPTAINRDYLAEVARVEPLVTGHFGIGLKLLMEIGLTQSHSVGAAQMRR